MKIPLEILLVEDNEGDIEITKRALRDETHCKLSVVNDGKEALDYLLKKEPYQNSVRPQVILLDINMPRMNGKEFLGVIKQNAQLKTIPVLMLTSSQSPQDIQECYERHASCYIVKPFDGIKFMDEVRQIVSFWGNLVLLPHVAETL